MMALKEDAETDDHDHDPDEMKMNDALFGDAEENDEDDDDALGDNADDKAMWNRRWFSSNSPNMRIAAILTVNQITKSLKQCQS